MFKRLFSKKKHKVRFCEKNLERFFDDAEIDNFSRIDRLEISEYKCLSNCERCEKTLYAELDGKLVEATDTKQLLEKIKEQVGK